MLFLCAFLFHPPDQDERVEKKQGSADVGEEDRKPRRKAYVHKPFLYSRYYSDSDDEITVEERRRSAVSCVNVKVKGTAQAECLIAFYSQFKGFTCQMS